MFLGYAAEKYKLILLKTGFNPRYSFYFFLADYFKKILRIFNFDLFKVKIKSNLLSNITFKVKNLSILSTTYRVRIHKMLFMIIVKKYPLPNVADGTGRACCSKPTFLA